MVYKSIIEGIGVNLRPMEESDAEFTYKLRKNQDKKGTRFVHSLNGTVEDQREYIKQQREKPGDYYFVVEDKQGTPIGVVAYYNIIGTEGEMGRMIIDGSFVQNCDAILQLRRFAFEIIGAKHVRCTVVNGNKPVLAQIRRLGGIQVGSHIDPIDKNEVLEFVVSREAYEKRKAKYEDLVKKGYELEKKRNNHI